MCGLVGAASSTALGVKGTRFIREALYVDQLRGEDSTGIALVDKENNISIYKKALPAADFLQTGYGLRAMDAAEDSFIALGHNRATTIGKSITQNAHPFQFGNFVGAHNGTIHNHKTLLDVSKYPVDSMNLIASIDHNNGDVVKVLTGLTSGAYAITVYDEEQQHMIFARNDGRPLSILQHEDYILWASEASMLYWLAERTGMLINKDSKPNWINVKEHEVLRYDCYNMTFLKPEKFTPKRYTGNYSSGWQQYLPNQGNKTSNKGTGTTQDTRIVHSGQTCGFDFDYTTDGEDFGKVMGMDYKSLTFLPISFQAYNQSKNASKDITDDPAGKIYGYIYDDGAAAMYPAVCWSAKQSHYDDSLASMTCLTAKVSLGYFTKDGNLIITNVSITGRETEEFTFYDNEYIALWEKENTAGLSYCVPKQMFLELKDADIKLAYQNLKLGRKVDWAPPVTGNGKQTALVATPARVSNVKKDETKITNIKERILAKRAEEKEQEEKEDSFRNVVKGTATTVIGPEGILSNKDFSVMTKDGCSMCSNEIYLDDHDQMSWDVSGEKPLPICPKCTGNHYDKLMEGAMLGDTVVLAVRARDVN